MLRREKRVESYDTPASVGIVSDVGSVPVASPVKNEKTVIGENIFIEGTLRGDEHLLMEGSMKGTIEMPKYNFSMGSKGRFEGEILAQNISISGQMLGKIRSQGKVEITKEADFLGDIKAKSISLEDGAYFKGSIELEGEPHRKPAAAARTIEVPVQVVEAKPAVQLDKK
jgi:cytoskeletal protein CcmA (bactofilin family)